MLRLMLCAALVGANGPRGSGGSYGMGHPGANTGGGSSSYSTAGAGGRHLPQPAPQPAPPLFFAVDLAHHDPPCPELVDPPWLEGPKMDCRPAVPPPPPRDVEIGPPPPLSLLDALRICWPARKAYRRCVQAVLR